MKAIYLYDITSREFKNSSMVDDNYVVQAGETEIKPTDGLYEPVTWSGTDWIGTDKAVWQAAQDAANAEYIKEHPEEAPQATSVETQLAAIAYQQMTDQQTMTDLQAQNAQIAYQLMTVQGGQA